ncbi:hypothetical protein Mapa_010885 [Marchantia paleacea]|nr:hypothetical protein Mapa_010885 [Marchantia paleacea]
MCTVEEYATNLTELAEEGKLDPVGGREIQIERVIQVLGRKGKKNPCLIGEPGVGKTAIVEGLARRIVAGDVPETIAGKKVISLEMGLLIAGCCWVGMFEESLQKVIEEVKQADDIILFIDEVHSLIGTGSTRGGLDAALILKPALARGQLQCIVATTFDDYRKHMEKDSALARRFTLVKVPEPTVDETILMLKSLRERYEIYHKLRYSDEALAAAAELSYRYISDRFLPDKAIDLIDEAGPRVRLRHAEAGQPGFEERRLQAQASSMAYEGQGESEAESECIEQGPTVTEGDIQQVVSAFTGIPVETVSTEESVRLLKMEETLHKRVIGQNEAIIAISRALRRSRVGLKSPNRPIANLFFSGPSGVGKTELGKALASIFYGSEKAVVRLDMSEFMEKHSVSKLTGSPPGYYGYHEGGQLTEAVRRRPFALILFDEIEKAHPDVCNILLQIMEDGRLTDGKGKTVDFKNTFVIMTSNLGSGVIAKAGGVYEKMKRLVTIELKKHFRPEFLNRLDDVLVFRQFTISEVHEIAGIILREACERLNKIQIDLEVSTRFRNRVVVEGYNSKNGARPLRRTVTRLLEDRMAECILAGEVGKGDAAVIDVDADGIITVVKKKPPLIPQVVD